MIDQKRVDPFGDDLGLSEFKPGAKKSPPSQAVREASEAAGFPSRAPILATRIVQKERLLRRRRTGRNVQLNLKVTAEVAALFTRLADDHGLVFGELLEQALDAFQRERAP